MLAGRILVVAPNAILRQSLSFALEAEGYVVTSHAELPPKASVVGYDAVVLDHKAASSFPEKAILLCEGPSPVVLLAGRPLPWLTNLAFRVVPTPLMGNALTATVADAVTAGRATQSH